jgi:hypothetical protein
MLASWESFPATVPAPLVEETPLLYRKGKRRAMTGLKVAEERERDASRQCRRDEREAAALAAADVAIEAREEEKREEAEILAANWVADTQLQVQLSQLSHLDADEDQQEADLRQLEEGSSSSELSDKQQEAEPGSQVQPLEISSDSEISGISDDEPRRSGRVKNALRTIQSQQWQIDRGLIPAPGAGGRARALNAKEKEKYRDFTVKK